MQLVPLETELVLFDKRLNKTGSYIQSVKRRVNDAETLLNLEPLDKSDKIELKNWEDKFKNVLESKEYSNFPSMNDILHEYAERAAKMAADKKVALEKAKRDEAEAIRRAKFRQLGDPVHLNLDKVPPESLNKVKELRKTKYFGETRTFGPSEIGAEIGTIKNYKGLNTIHTKERTLRRRDGRKTSFEKDTPPWMGPGYYDSSKAEHFLGAKQPGLDIPFKTISRDVNPTFGGLDHDEIRDRRLTTISSRRNRSRTPSPEKDPAVYYSTLSPCDRLIRTMSRGIDLKYFDDDSSSGMFIKSVGELPKTMRDVSSSEKGKKRRDFCGGGLLLQKEEPLDDDIDYLIEDDLVDAVNDVRRQHHSVNLKHDIYKIKSISDAGQELEALAKAERTRVKAQQDAKKKELLELKNKQQNDMKTKAVKEAVIKEAAIKEDTNEILKADDDNHRILYHPLKKKKVDKFKKFNKNEVKVIADNDPLVKEVLKSPLTESIKPVLKKWYSAKHIYSPSKQPKTTGYLNQYEALPSLEINPSLLLENTTNIELLDLPKNIHDYLDNLTARASTPMHNENLFPTIESDMEDMSI